MHIGNVSGHYCASMAIEKALQEVDAQVQTHRIDALNYTNSHLAKFLYRLYLFVVKAAPWFWEYLYDNKNILEKIHNDLLANIEFAPKNSEKTFGIAVNDYMECTLIT